MSGSLGFNSRRLSSANRPITLGSMLSSGHNGPASTKRVYNWNKTANNVEPFTATFGITRGYFGPPSTPFSTYHPYYSSNMYLYR